MNATYFVDRWLTDPSRVVKFAEDHGTHAVAGILDAYLEEWNYAVENHMVVFILSLLIEEELERVS